MATICAIVVSTFIWIILIFSSVPFFLMVFLPRFLITRLVRLFNKEVDKIVPGESAAFFNTNKRKEVSFGIFIGLEGRIEVEEILHKFESKVIYKNDSKGQLLRPELQQFPISFCNYYFWKWDVNFNLKNHIVQLQITPEWDQKPKNAQEILETFREKVLVREWPKNRSPWEILVVQNFQDSPLHGLDLAPPATGTLLILRAHHAIGDGTSSRELFQDLLSERNNETGSAAVGYPEKVKRNCIGGFKEGFCTYFFGPWDLIRVSVQNLPRNQGLADNGPTLPTHAGRYNIGVTPTVPVDLILRIRKSENVTFEAVVLAVFLNAYARFTANVDHILPDQLVFLSAYGLPRYQYGKMRNSNTAVPLLVPTKIEGHKALNSIDESLQEIITSGAPEIALKFAKLMGSLPARMRSWVDNILVPNSLLEASFVLSNVLPFPEDLYFNRTHKVRTAFATSGGEEGSTSLICVTVGCKEGIRFVFHVDNRIVSREKISGEVLAQYFMEELQLWTRKSL